MNKLCFFILFIFLPFITKAQKPEPLNWQIVYTFTHVYDTSLRQNPLTEKQQLLIGNSSSHYVKGTHIPETRKAQEQAAPTGAVQVVAAVPIAMVNDPFYVTMDVFQYPAQQKMAKAERIGVKEFLLETSMPVIDWKLNTATKEILGYKCQQATGQFGGRTYTAWFAIDLPMQYGPWKLNGLPGIILEATDEKKEVVFVATAITKGAEGQLTDYESNSYITTTEPALARAKKAYEENPVATMQAQLSPGSAAPRLKFRDITGKTYNGADAEAQIEKRASDMRNGLFNPLELAK